MRQVFTLTDDLNELIWNIANVSAEVIGGDTSPTQILGHQSTFPIVRAREIAIALLRRHVWLQGKPRGQRPGKQRLAMAITFNGQNPFPQSVDSMPISTPMVAHILDRDHSTVVLALKRLRTNTEATQPMEKAEAKLATFYGKDAIYIQTTTTTTIKANREKRKVQHGVESI
jgi:hypothetical protein